MSVKAIETNGETYREIELFRPDEFETGAAYCRRNFVINGEVVPLYEKNPTTHSGRYIRCEKSKDLWVREEDL